MTATEQRECIKASDIVPGEVLDRTIDRAMAGYEFEQSAYDETGKEGDGCCRYSRDLRIALDLWDDMDSLTLAIDNDLPAFPRPHPQWGIWKCRVKWTDKDTKETFGGEGRDRDPALAICRAVLAMFDVEIIDE